LTGFNLGFDKVLGHFEYGRLHVWSTPLKSLIMATPTSRTQLFSLTTTPEARPFLLRLLVPYGWPQIIRCNGLAPMADLFRYHAPSHIIDRPVIEVPVAVGRQ
jgi:hypothetical protein